jgi:hypothetical protein
MCLSFYEILKDKADKVQFRELAELYLSKDWYSYFLWYKDTEFFFLITESDSHERL